MEIILDEVLIKTETIVVDLVRLVAHFLVCLTASITLLPQLMSQRMRIFKMALHQNVFGELKDSKSHRAVIRIKFFQLLTRTNPTVDLNTT